MTSDGEYFDIELTEPISSDIAVKRLNDVMVEGMEIVSFVEISEDKKDRNGNCFRCRLYFFCEKWKIAG